MLNTVLSVVRIYLLIGLGIGGVCVFVYTFSNREEHTEAYAKVDAASSRTVFLAVLYLVFLYPIVIFRPIVRGIIEQRHKEKL